MTNTHTHTHTGTITACAALVISCEVLKFFLLCRNMHHTARRAASSCTPVDTHITTRRRNTFAVHAPAAACYLSALPLHPALPRARRVHSPSKHAHAGTTHVSRGTCRWVNPHSQSRSHSHSHSHSYCHSHSHAATCCWSRASTPALQSVAHASHVRHLAPPPRRRHRHSPFPICPYTHPLPSLVSLPP